MYEVKIEIDASPSKYSACLTFLDQKGIRHEKNIVSDCRASKNSNYLQAAIEAVRVLQKPCMLSIYSASDYLIEPFKQGWIKNWEKHNWTNAKGKTVGNVEQWKELRKLLAQHSARFLKVEKYE